MGGGGGGDDYSAKQAQIDAKKTAARNSLNAAFGVAPTASAAPVAGTSPRGGYGSIYEPDAGMAAPGPDPLASQASANKTARDTLYSTVRDNAFNAGKRGFDERKTDASRNNKFALYAQGLQGGSVDVDQNALIDRTYHQGLLDLGAKADSAKTELQSGDEQARLQLLQSIDAGMDEGSALSSALGQMQVNSNRASAAAQGTNLGDLFADSGALYTKSQAARGQQYAMNNNPFAYFTRGRGNNPGASGVISTTGV